MRSVKTIGKIVMAGVTALAILSILLCFYDILPVHHENLKGNTDYVWQSNAIWVKLTEGISWGKFDSDGFNNPQVIENPDIIICGSSHMEALNVFFDQTVCSRLWKKLNNRYSVYNLGMSGHDFYRTCQYLPVNLKMYNPAPKIAIIETQTINLKKDKVNMVLNSEIEHIPSYTTGIIAIMQKIPFFRSVYHQVEEGLLNIFIEHNSVNNSSKDSQVKKNTDNVEIDETPYDELFHFLGDLESKFGTQIIIFYHPGEQFDESGGIFFKSSSSKEIKLFNEYAKKYGIDFVDMTSAFEDMYYTDHLVAHGFVTGKIGEGHLNANGHKAIAEELYKVIETLEKEGALCK